MSIESAKAAISSAKSILRQVEKEAKMAYEISHESYLAVLDSPDAEGGEEELDALLERIDRLAKFCQVVADTAALGNTL